MINKNYIYRFILAGAVLLILIEGLARLIAGPSINYALAEKQLHCLDRNSHYVFLCPDVSIKLDHPKGFSYTVTTNVFGERITRHGPSPFALEDHFQNKIWMLGDSITMGYPLNDQYSPPFILERIAARPVRNLGIDSLGVLGIHRRLNLALETHEQRPAHMFWIFNASDFLDDIRDAKRDQSVLRKEVFRIQFYLSRYLVSFNYFKEIVSRLRNPDEVNERNIEQAGMTAEWVPDASHPTFENIRELLGFIDAKGLSLTLVIYPFPDDSLQKPHFDDPVLDKTARVFKEAGGDVLDVRPYFASAQRLNNLYIPKDGHPSAVATQIIAEAILEYIEENKI